MQLLKTEYFESDISRFNSVLHNNDCKIILHNTVKYKSDLILHYFR